MTPFFPTPFFPILVIDCTFEGQSQAAIASDEGGLAIVRPRITNVPTAVSTAPDKADELWISDARFENISGPALVIGNAGIKGVRYFFRYPRSPHIYSHRLSTLAAGLLGRSNLPEAAILEPCFSYLDRKRPGREISPLLGLLETIMVRRERNVKPAKRA